MVIADTVNKQVYEIIKAMILERKLKPGERIDAKRIAAENGVSMMPVRNALHQLTTQGLVVTVQRVGFFVRQFSNAELEQINDMRKMFELYCIQNYFDNIALFNLLSLDFLLYPPIKHISCGNYWGYLFSFLFFYSIA
jgi:DNA-binding GntR family transcriptional regulator